MQVHNAQLDVLIVGAGPVGLFLANECARRHLRYRIVEKNPSQSEHSKALAIFPRTLEIFDMAGLVSPFLEVANRATSVEVLAHGRTLAHMPFAPEDSVYPFIAMVPQDVTERLLVQHLAAQGGKVEYATSCVDAVERDDHVSVTLEHNGEREESSAAFVVGCDGAHSLIRHLLNLTFEGAEYHDLFLLADIDTNDGLPADQLQLCPHESGPLAIFPMSATRRRIVAMIQQPEGDAPSLDLVRKMLVERAPQAIQAHALRWSSYFHIHHRHVSQLRVGRMFVAGDAAHIHSPFGGQGMNTGLQDVWNLAWKLDLALSGHGNERLLDSYTAERLPVIKQVVETTDRLTRVMGTPNRFAQTLRDTVIPMVSRLAPFQHAFVERLSELGVAYRGSPIVDGAGKRHFDESVRGGQGICNRFLLLIDEDADPVTMQEAARLTESFEEVVELRASRHQGITLVRPDGYVAWEGTVKGEDTPWEAIRSLLREQTGDTVAETTQAGASGVA